MNLVLFLYNLRLCLPQIRESLYSSIMFKKESKKVEQGIFKMHYIRLRW
jgi:hypothetical protein